MALSGSFYNYPVNQFGLYCEWSGSQNVIGNYTAVTLKVYLSYYDLYCGAKTGTASINGTSDSISTAAISDSSTGWKKKLIKTLTVNVSHNSDGTKTGVSLSASWAFNGTYAGKSISTITANTTVSLNTIDRTAPSVTLTTSNTTTSGVSITAKSSAAANQWQYSLNSGSWVTFSSASGLSASYSITGLSPNTSYSIRVRARKSSNDMYGTSSAATVKTIGRSIINSVSNFAADADTVKITMNVTVYNAGYTHRILIRNETDNYLTIENITWSKGTADRTITLTAAQRATLLSGMASIKSFTANVYLTTYDSGTALSGYSSKTCSVSTSSSRSSPDPGDFTVTDINAVTTGVTGSDKAYVQNLSSLRITPAGGTAKNGASIAGYSVSCCGRSASNTTGAALDIGAVTKSGSQSVTLTVTDSRGYATTRTVAISIIAYANPKVGSMSARRRNGVESTLQLVFSGSFSSVKVSGTEKNSLYRIRCRYKLTSDSSYGSYIGITPQVTVTGTSFSYTNLELCELDVNNSYDFHIQIQDAFTSASSVNLYYVIPQGIPVVSMRKNKIGINVHEPEATLHIGGDLRLGDQTMQDFVVAQGSNATWEWRKWNSGKAELWGTLNKPSVAITNTWGNVYCSGSLATTKAYYPFVLTKTPVVLFSPDASGGGVWLSRGGTCEAATNEHTGTLEAFRGTSSTIRIIVNYYVFGYWK